VTCLAQLLEQANKVLRRAAAFCLRRTCREMTPLCYRRAVNARGHFAHEAAAMKCLYLIT